MADNADLVIKVAADTSAARRDIASTKKEVDRLKQSGERWQQSANKALSVTRTGLRFGRLGYRAYRVAQAAAQASGLVARGRIVAGGAFGAASAGLLGGRAATAARWAGRIPGVGVLGGAAAGLAVFRSMRNWTKKTAELAEKHADLMADLLRESRITNRTIGTIQAGRLAAADPYGRGVRYWSREMAYLAPSAGERQSLGMLAAERIRTEQLRNAADRARGASGAGFRILRERLSQGYHQTRLDSTRFLDHVTSTPSGNMALQMSGPIGMGYSMYRQMGNAFQNVFRDPNAGGPLTQEMTSRLRMQARRQRGIDLARLEARGPDVTAGPAPGFRAGTAEEYAFRVQQHSIARNREATIRWQDEVLRLLRQAVEEGTLDPNVIVQRQIAYGRPVSTPEQVE